MAVKTCPKWIVKAVWAAAVVAAAAKVAEVVEEAEEACKERTNCAMSLASKAVVEVDSPMAAAAAGLGEMVAAAALRETAALRADGATIPPFGPWTPAPRPI